MTDLRYTARDGAVAVHAGDVLVARYRAETPASKPHLDTLALPPGADGVAGRNLVLTAPHDHAWHLGGFFCQKLVDGVNCWESERDEALGRLHGRAADRHYTVDGDGESVTVSQHVAWESSAGDHLLVDERDVTVHAPEGDSYLVTWDQTLSAPGRVRHLASETVHGHYSGLSMRFRRSMTGGDLRVAGEAGLDPGAEPATLSDPDATWCDYTGPLDGKRGAGDPWRAGVSVVWGPDAPDDAVNWFAMTRPFGFLAANPTLRRVRRLGPEESVSWRWGLLVHAGGPDPEAVAAARDRL